jgi:hypothetical protein
MLSKSLSTSRKFAALYQEAGELAEFCQSLYPLIIAHSDDFGRLQGDVFSVKHLLLPASPRTLEHFDTALTALQKVGLVTRYSGKNEKMSGEFLQVVYFERHQVGLHKRANISQFPDPTIPAIPDNSGNSRKILELPAQLNRSEVNLTEGKGREGNGAAAPPTPKGPIFGTKNPHTKHAFCGKVCFPEALASEYQQRMNHLPDPFGYVREFFRTWDDRYTAGDRTTVVIGEDAFDFWRARWLETHPVVNPDTSRATLVAKALERLERDDARFGRKW